MMLFLFFFLSVSRAEIKKVKGKGRLLEVSRRILEGKSVARNGEAEEIK